jgi:rmuC family protein
LRTEQQRTLEAQQRARQDGAVLTALEPVREQLEHMALRVEQMELQRSKQNAIIAERLRASDATQERLRASTASLESALRSRSARGMWGEMELRRVLELGGMSEHIDFELQKSVSTLRKQNRAGSLNAAPSPANGSARPDATILLPGGEFLAIDAKAPLDAFLRGADAGAKGDQDAANSYLSDHAAAVRSHINELIRRNYPEQLGQGPQFTIMFIPSEAVLSAALEVDASLLEYALANGVLLTTPISLLAVARTVADAWMQNAINDDARQLLAIGSTLYKRLGTVARYMDDLGASLRRSVQTYNKTVNSIEKNLLSTAKGLENLGNTLTSPSPIASEAAQIRSFSAPELTNPDLDDSH